MEAWRKMVTNNGHMIIISLSAHALIASCGGMMLEYEKKPTICVAKPKPKKTTPHGI